MSDPNTPSPQTTLGQITGLVKAAEPTIRWIAIIVIGALVLTGKISQDQVNDWMVKYGVGVAKQAITSPSAPQ